MLLTSISDIIRIVTSSTADIDIQAAWADITTTTLTPGRTNTKVTSATTTTIVASPAASTQRQVKTLVIRNIHASTANDITVQHYDGTNSVTVYKATLSASESILYTGAEWIAYDSSGTPISLTAVNLADGDYGDVTIGGSGTTMTIDNNAVTLAKLATQAANTVLANATTGAAVPTAVTVAEQTLVGRITGGNVDDLSATQARTLLNVADGANAYVHPNHSGDVTSVADGAQTIGAKKVTVAMLADGTDGELITWNATGVAATVAVGTATHVLTSNGTGAAPTFQAAPSGGASVANIGSTAETVGGSVDNGVAATASRSDHKHAITAPALASAVFANQGTTTTVLHGNAAGNPAWGAVVEADITLADNTTANASTSNHGLVVKATAPAAGLMNFVGLTNAETAYTNKPLFDTTNPAATGTAAPGTQVIAARRDHVHAAPTTITGNAATVTVADAADDTTTWPLLGTAETGSLAPATDAGLTYNASTAALTATTFIGALTGTVGAVTPSTVAATTLAASTAGNPLTLTNSTDNASVQVGILQGDRATIADNDEAYVSLKLSDSAGNQDEGARVTWKATTVLNGATQDTDLILSALVNNTLTPMLTLDGSASEIVPAVAINSAANITGAIITTNTGLAPDANDGAYLGTTALQFSDLFLAEGGVINFDNGDVTITQVGNTLTITGGSTIVDSIELGAATDTTITRSGAGAIQVEGVQVLLSGAALGTPASGTVTNLTGTASININGTVGATTPAAGTFTTITPNTSIILQENAPIILDPALSADGKYSGITIAGTAGAALAFGDLCYLAAADSRWELADSDAEATAGPVKLGICVLAAAGDASATTMLLMGTVRADAAFPTLTISAPAYVGTTAGDIQVAAPSGAADIIRVVGWATTAHELYFNPSGDWFEHV